MGRPQVSIVMATFERGHILSRSLEAYKRHDFDNNDLELVVIDDHSTDHTDSLVKTWSRETGIRCTVVTPSPKNDYWRDCGAILNCGIRAAAGDYILLTHPEVIPGKKSVKRCVSKLAEFEYAREKAIKATDNLDCGPIGLYACCRVYYLSPRDQVRLDSVPWKEQGNLAVRKIEDFYEIDPNGAPDFSHQATDIVAQPGSRMPKWESWVFGGCSRQTWRLLGGMLETQKWGSVDVAFMTRRNALGIPNHTCSEDDSIVIHQNHGLPGDVETPRIEDEWKRELRHVDLLNATNLCFPRIDYLGWG